MKRGMRTLSLLLALLMIIGVCPLEALAEETNFGVTVLENENIMITVDNATGRFGIRTIEGQPARKNDQNMDMTFNARQPDTSFTTFKINGTDYIFGNPYKFAADFFSEITKPQIVQFQDGSRQIETIWKIEGVSIKQILKLYPDTDNVSKGNVSIRYEVQNSSGKQVDVGSRILLDTMLASNDGPAFQIGTIADSPLTVERRLTHNPEEQGISEYERNYYKLPSYWVMKDTLDPTNPLATNIIAYGFNNFAEGGVNIVDEMVVGHWNRLANTKWGQDDGEYIVNPNLDFTVDTNDYGSADSAVAFYWQPDSIAAGQLKTFETLYGLGEIVEPTKVFDIRYLDPPIQLGTNDENTEYIDDGVFEITVEVENLAMYDMEHSKVTGELTLENGLDFVKTSNGRVIRDASGNPVTTGERSQVVTYIKTQTLEQIENNESPSIVPGDVMTFKFTVMGTGKPWPSTKEYMFAVTSPELETQFQAADEETKALYKSSRTNFIFLPAIGEGQATVINSVSPEDVYYTDEKFIAVNMTNMEAYNPGSAVVEPNFDVYFVEMTTGKRYKVYVKDSVLMQATDDGFTGDMRISYRTGDIVDEKGVILKDENGNQLKDVGATMDTGSYRVEIDFHQSSGMTEEEAAAFDVVSSQTFTVSKNQETRIRQAAILAVVKETVQLTGGDSEALTKMLNQITAELNRIVEPMEALTNKVTETLAKIDEYTAKAAEYAEKAQNVPNMVNDLVDEAAAAPGKFADEKKAELEAKYDEVETLVTEFINEVTEMPSLEEFTAPLYEALENAANGKMEQLRALTDMPVAIVTEKYNRIMEMKKTIEGWYDEMTTMKQYIESGGALDDYKAKAQTFLENELKQQMADFDKEIAGLREQANSIAADYQKKYEEVQAQAAYISSIPTKIQTLCTEVTNTSTALIKDIETIASSVKMENIINGAIDAAIKQATSAGSSVLDSITDMGAAELQAKMNVISAYKANAEALVKEATDYYGIVTNPETYTTALTNEYNSVLGEVTTKITDIQNKISGVGTYLQGKATEYANAPADYYNNLTTQINGLYTQMQEQVGTLATGITDLSALNDLEKLLDFSNLYTEMTAALGDLSSSVSDASGLTELQNLLNFSTELARINEAVGFVANKVTDLQALTKLETDLSAAVSKAKSGDFSGLKALYGEAKDVKLPEAQKNLEDILAFKNSFGSQMQQLYTRVSELPGDLTNLGASELQKRYDAVNAFVTKAGGALDDALTRIKKMPNDIKNLGEEELEKKLTVIRSFQTSIEDWTKQAEEFIGVTTNLDGYKEKLLAEYNSVLSELMTQKDSIMQSLSDIPNYIADKAMEYAKLPSEYYNKLKEKIAKEYENITTATKDLMEGLVPNGDVTAEVKRLIDTLTDTMSTAATKAAEGALGGLLDDLVRIVKENVNIPEEQLQTRLKELYSIQSKIDELTAIAKTAAEYTSPDKLQETMDAAKAEIDNQIANAEKLASDAAAKLADAPNIIAKQASDFASRGMDAVQAEYDNMKSQALGKYNEVVEELMSFFSDITSMPDMSGLKDKMLDGLNEIFTGGFDKDFLLSMLPTQIAEEKAAIVEEFIGELMLLKDEAIGFAEGLIDPNTYADAALEMFDEQLEKANEMIKELQDELQSIYDDMEAMLSDLYGLYDQFMETFAVYKDLIEDMIETLDEKGVSGLMEEFGSMLLDAAQLKLKAEGTAALYKGGKELIYKAAEAVDMSYKAPKNDDGTYAITDAVPVYSLKAFTSEEEYEAFFTSYAAIKEDGTQVDPTKDVLVTIRGMIKQVGDGSDVSSYIVDTETEPAVINNSVLYSGKDLVFANDAIDIFGIKEYLSETPFFDHLAVKGDGTLSLITGFVFHEGEWSIDFFNGFDKSSTAKSGKGVLDTVDKAPEDTTENGSTAWAVGGLGDKLNPLRQVVLDSVYFNRNSLFSAPSFSVAGFGLSFNEYILGQGEICFGGSLSMKIVNAEVRNVSFDREGLRSIDAELLFKLQTEMGMLQADEKGGGGAKGQIIVKHYREDIAAGRANEYGVSFDANLKNVAVIGCTMSFKTMPDKRVLPDVIAFKAGFGTPGVLITGTTYLKEIRGAIKELAATIAGGDNEVPLTLEAGADITFGVKPATFDGKIDLTLKSSGIKLEGSLKYSGKPMLKMAMIEARWLTPWFVKAEAEVDVMGWGVIIGNAKIFVGQNLEKNRIDFEGMVGAALVIPSSVPVIGGMELARISMGLNNDKIWGSATIGVAMLQVSFGVTYYWSGGLTWGTSGEGLPDGYAHLLVTDPDNGDQRMIVLGQGIKTMATSWVSDDKSFHELVYHDLDNGITMLDNGSMDVGVGGIKISNEGKTHVIPVGSIYEQTPLSDALIEVEYFDDEVPSIRIDHNGSSSQVVIGDPQNPNALANANAYLQDQELDGVVRHKIIVMAPRAQISSAQDEWTLVSDQTIETKLLSLPQAASISSAKMTDIGENSFTANVKCNNLSDGDTINLYLTPETEGDKIVLMDDGSGSTSEIIEPSDPGTLVAKDIVPDSSGSITMPIDLTNVTIMGETADVTGLMSQGDYYLRAELAASSSFDSETSAEKIRIKDINAPDSVEDLSVTPDGNGYFAIGFKPAEKKAGQENSAVSYLINVSQKNVDGVLEAYPNLDGLLFTEEELAEYWNEETGRYDNIRIGGWKASEVLLDVVDDEGNTTGETTETVYTGLETGKKYIIGVSAAAKPEGDENDHFALRTDSAETLLPLPAKPKLTLKISELQAMSDESVDAYEELTTNIPSPSIDIAADQQNVEVEVICGDDSYGKFPLTNVGSGSMGTVAFNEFSSDGTYCVELKAQNTITKDYSITVLYLTIDTVSPFIYIESPTNGQRSEGGMIRVVGETSTDTANLTVGGYTLTADKEGHFDQLVPVTGEDSTIDMQIMAVDKAGNSNSATVNIMNGGFKTPTALVLRSIPALEIGDTKQAEAYLRYPDGKDISDPTNIVQKYREERVSGEGLNNISFSVMAGSAAVISDKGLITAQDSGANIFNAEYRVSDDKVLSTQLAVRVNDADNPLTGFTRMVLSCEPVTGSDQKTTFVLTNSSNEGRLVYKLYPAGSSVTLPIQGADLSDWTSLPVNRIVPASDGQFAVVALCDSSNKAIGVSNRATVVTDVAGRLVCTVNKVDGSYEKSLVQITGQTGSFFYKLTSSVPTIGDDVSDWTALPSSGLIDARSSDSIVVVSRDAEGKCTAVSSALKIVTESFKSFTASSSPIENSKVTTKVTVPAAAAGTEYVYCITTASTIPTLYSALTDYTLLPADGIVSVSSGSKISVALRKTSGTYAIGAAPLVSASIWSESSPGGGGGGGGVVAENPVSPGNTTVNGTTVEETITDNKLSLDVSSGSGNTGNQDVDIVTGNNEAAEYQFTVKQELVDQLKYNSKNINIETPNASVTVPASKITGSQDVTVTVTENTDEDISQASNTLAGENVSVLSGGVDVNVTGTSEQGGEAVGVRVPVPEDIQTSDITAVVCISKDGSWTPIPFSIDMEGNKAYADVSLNTSGKIVFVKGTVYFTDVPENHWGHDSIYEAASKLFVYGKGNNIFDMTSNISRAEYITILLRVGGFMNLDAGDVTMADVSQKDWYYKSMAIGSRIGLVEGTGEGIMSPLASVTRQEAMTMVGRMIRLTSGIDKIEESEVDQILRSFGDIENLGTWARADAALCIKHGIIVGSNGNLLPLDPMNRVQGAAIANRLDKVITE